MAYQEGMLAQRINALALVGLVGLACTIQEEAGRSDEVRLWYFPNLATHPEETIEGAEEILGLDLQVVTDPQRAVIVFFLEDLPIDGAAASSDPCGRALWAGDHEESLAHELGHALSLEHNDIEGNLMYGEHRGGIDLTDEQIDTMRWAAWWLETKCAQ
jgi:hypothetical protein